MYPKLPDPLDAGWDHMALLLAVEGIVDGQIVIAGMTQKHRRITLTISGWGQGVVGFRLSPFGAEEELMDWAREAVCVGRKSYPLTWRNDGGKILITGDDIPLICLRMNPFAIEILPESGPSWSTSEFLGTIHERPIAPPTAWYDSSSAITASRLSLRLPSSIHFGGMGERFFSTQLEGRTLQSWNEDADGVRTKAAYKTVPFVISNQGWGLWFNSPGLSVWDLGDTTPLAMTVTTPQSVLEWCVITGPRPKDIIQRYVTLTGLPDSVPAWAAGVWLSTGFLQRTQADIVAIAAEAKSREFPADVFHVDCYWQQPGAWGGTQWNTARITQPSELIRELRTMGYHVSLWSQPYLEEGSAAFVAAANAGLLLKASDAEGPWLGNLWGDADSVLRVGVMDFTHPQVKDWYSQQYQAILSAGVEVLKVDFGEEVPPESHTHAGFRGGEIRNLYALEYARSLYETVRAVQPEGMVWVRPGYSGIQRFPAAWPGDPHPTLDDLRLTVQGGINAAASGIAHWAVDIGGFKDEPTPEEFVRWAQFGMFAPLTRFHRSVKPLPWEYGEDVFRMVRELARLRYRLVPYLRALYQEAHERGTPVLRPLWMEFPEDCRAWAGFAEYLLGDALLIAPVTTASGTVSFHVPRGRWLDWFSGNLVDGPCDITRQEALATFPLFMRQGVVIPMMPEPSVANSLNTIELVCVHELGVGHRNITSRNSADTVIEGAVEISAAGHDRWLVRWHGRWPINRTVRIKRPIPGYRWEVVNRGSPHIMVGEDDGKSDILLPLGESASEIRRSRLQ